MNSGKARHSLSSRKLRRCLQRLYDIQARRYLAFTLNMFSLLFVEASVPVNSTRKGQCAGKPLQQRQEKRYLRASTIKPPEQAGSALKAKKISQFYT